MVYNWNSNSNIVMFNVQVKEDGTQIEEVEGFEILPIDIPPDIYEFVIDEPPTKGNE